MSNYQFVILSAAKDLLFMLIIDGWWRPRTGVSAPQ